MDRLWTKDYNKYISPERDMEIRFAYLVYLLKKNFKGFNPHIQKFILEFGGINDKVRLGALWNMKMVQKWEWYLWGKKHQFSTKNFSIYPISKNNYYFFTKNDKLFSKISPIEASYGAVEVKDATEVLYNLNKYYMTFMDIKKGKILDD